MIFRSDFSIIKQSMLMIITLSVSTLFAMESTSQPNLSKIPVIDDTTIALFGKTIIDGWEKIDDPQKILKKKANTKKQPKRGKKRKHKKEEERSPTITLLLFHLADEQHGPNAQKGVILSFPDLPLLFKQPYLFKRFSIYHTSVSISQIIDWKESLKIVEKPIPQPLEIQPPLKKRKSIRNIAEESPSDPITPGGAISYLPKETFSAFYRK